MSSHEEDGGGSGDQAAAAAAQVSMPGPADVPDPLNPEIEQEILGKFKCNITYPNLKKMKLKEGDVPKCTILEDPEETTDRKRYIVFTVERPSLKKVVYRHSTRGIPFDNSFVIKEEKADVDKDKVPRYKVKIRKTTQEDFMLKSYFIPGSPPHQF